MFKKFALAGNYKWVARLEEFVGIYNSRINRITKFAPKDINSENEYQIWKDSYKKVKKIVRKLKYKLGDFVRITRKKVI